MLALVQDGARGALPLRWRYARTLHALGAGAPCANWRVALAVLIVIAHNLEISGFLIATTLLFVVFFALGNGSIPWLITGEMFTQGYHHHHHHLHAMQIQMLLQVQDLLRLP